MKKTLILPVLTGLLCLGGAGAALADDHGNEWKVIPVELFACTFNEGKGPKDLTAAIDKWNEWADKDGLDSYSAWTLTPYYYGPEQEFDFLWLGAGKDAIALGKAQDAYLTEDAGLRAGFNSAISCNAHVKYASIQFKPPKQGATPGNSVLTFSDCSLKEGASWDAVNAASVEWSKHLSEAGSEAGIWHWYPAYGGGDEDFDFKWLESHENFAALGADFESYGNGGGYKVAGGLFGELLDCDSNRAYLAKNHRYAQLR